MKRTRGKKGRIMGRVMDQQALLEVRDLIKKESLKRDMLIEHLHKIQDKFHHISNRHILALAQEMNLPMAEIYETATFYHHFDVIKEGETPPPPLTVRVCDSLACDMFGAKQLIEDLNSANYQKVRIQPVPCVGRCHAAPVAIVGTNPVENATPEKVSKTISDKKTEAEMPCCISYEDYKKDGGYKTLQDCI